LKQKIAWAFVCWGGPVYRFQTLPDFLLELGYQFREKEGHETTNPL
jgi:hypothetical protein